MFNRLKNLIQIAKAEARRPFVNEDVPAKRKPLSDKELEQTVEDLLNPKESDYEPSPEKDDEKVSKATEFDYNTLAGKVGNASTKVPDWNHDTQAGKTVHGSTGYIPPKVNTPTKILDRPNGLGIEIQDMSKDVVQQSDELPQCLQHIKSIKRW